MEDAEAFKRSGFKTIEEYDFNQLYIAYQNYYFSKKYNQEKIDELNNLLLNPYKTTADDRTIEGLRNEISQMMNNDEFKDLCEAMVDSPFVKDRYVPRQGVYYNGPAYSYIHRKYIGGRNIATWSENDRVWLYHRQRMLSSLLRLESAYLNVGKIK